MVIEPYEDPIIVDLSLTGSRWIMGTDGSVNPEHRLATWAGVRGDGRAIFGWCTPDSDLPTSDNAELRAVRCGLRLYETGDPVWLRLDNEGAINAIRFIQETGNTWQAHGARYRNGQRMGWCADRATAKEIRDHLRRLDVSIEYVGDPEGTTVDWRAPAEPAMKAAHRLAWAAQRCLAHGLSPYDTQVQEFLVKFASGESRAAKRMRVAFARWVEQLGYTGSLSEGAV